MWGAAVFAAALGVRLVHLWALRDAPVFDVLLGDAQAYDAWAQRLAAGDWVGNDVFYQAPLYPYFLGVLYALAGRDLFLARLVQAIIGSLAAVLLMDAGTRLFSRRVGLLAGFAMALYAPAIFFDSLLQKSVLDVFLVCLTIWVTSRLVDAPSRGRLWLGLGMTMGALALTRENALVLVAVAFAWALLTWRASRTARERSSGRRPEDARPRSGLAIFGPQPLLLVCGLAVVLTPIVVRNYAVTGGFYLTTSQFGPNFYIGNNPGSDGTYMSLRPGRGAPEFERQDATELAEAALGRSLTPAEVSSYWTERALGFITSEPGRWLALLARKTALLWNTSEMLDTESQETYEDYSPLLRMLSTVGHFGVLVPLAVIGLVSSWPDRRRLWPLLALFAAYAASVVLFYVFARYRFPLVPFLVLLAAQGVVSAHALFARLAPAGRLATAAALALIVLAVNWPMLPAARMRAITETNLGTALHEAGRNDEAIAHYERAVALQPDYAPAYNNLGVTLRAIGRVDDAIRAYQQGLALKGDYPDLHFNLANALLEQNRTDEAASHLRASLAKAPASAGSHNNLGMALAATGQYVEAAAEFRAAVAAAPNSAVAHHNLGNVLATLGQRAEARAELERAVTLDPKDASAAYDLGSVLLDAGLFAEAARRFEASLALNPRSVESLNNLGIALASQGRIKEAATLFERALAIDPTNADAQRNLETARQALGK